MTSESIRRIIANGRKPLGSGLWVLLSFCLQLMVIGTTMPAGLLSELLGRVKLSAKTKQGINTKCE
jgi:hypothetical protein